MATNFSKVWPKLSWPQRSSQVTHYHGIMLYSQKVHLQFHNANAHKTLQGYE